MLYIKVKMSKMLISRKFNNRGACLSNPGWTKMKIVKHYFNMVEIALAMAVVGLGIAGIMSLFPVGINASRDAVADNYSADAADQLLHYLAAASQSNWGLVTGLSTTPPTITDSDTSTNWTHSAGLPDNLYNSTNTGVTNVYGIKQGSDGNIDFIAHLKIWKSQITGDYWNGNKTGSNKAGSANIPYTKAARINLEISWPVSKPYSAREKRYYSIEVFNNN